jgi:hypothetical protein
MGEVYTVRRSTWTRILVPLAVMILLAALVVPILWFYYERANIDRLNEEMRRLGGYAEIPEGASDPWRFHIQLIVDLNNTSVGDEQFARLQRVPGFKHVEILGLEWTRITDRSLEVLEGYPGLITLNLSRTGVTDTGMESLAKLPALNSISLSGTTLTDAGLDSLIRNRQYLVSIDVTRTQVTAEGLRRLRKAFPQVYITPDAPPGP